MFLEQLAETVGLFDLRKRNLPGRVWPTETDGRREEMRRWREKEEEVRKRREEVRKRREEEEEEEKMRQISPGRYNLTIQSMIDQFNFRFKRKLSGFNSIYRIFNSKLFLTNSFNRIFNSLLFLTISIQ